MRVLLAVFLLALAPPASAQPGEVWGRVLDAGTREGIPGANVVFSGTQSGAAADLDGHFRLVTALRGEHVLIVSAVGFTTQTVAVEVGAAPILVELREQPLGLGEAVVQSEDARDWRRRLARFERLFVGQSRLADQTDLLNPEVLDLSDSAARGLVAEVEAPLRVENRGLGYVLTFHDLAFMGTGERRQWEGAVSFEPIVGQARQARAWRRARERAYHGSWQHFLHAWARGTLQDEGFLVHPVARPGDVPRIGAPLSDADLTAPLRAADSTGAETLRLRTGGGAWMVLYTREEDDSQYRRPGNGNPQRSWFTVRPGSVDVTRDGQVLQPLRIVRYGYWDWERVAELLPFEYRPQPDG